jgi:hypothetical protein
MASRVPAPGQAWAQQVDAAKQAFHEAAHSDLRHLMESNLLIIDKARSTLELAVDRGEAGRLFATPGLLEDCCSTLALVG